MSEHILAIMESASNSFDVTMLKVDSYLEAVDRQFEINKQKAELKVMKESGTEDDLAMLFEAAEGSVADSILKAIEKIKDAIIKFFSDVKSMIIEKFSKANFDDQIDALDKKIKLLPLLSKKQVIVEDTEQEEKIFKKAISKLSAIKAKLKSGQKVDAEEIYAVEEEYNKESSKIAGIASGVKTTLSGAIAKVKDMVKSHSKKVADAEKETVSTLDEMKKVAEDKPENAANAEKVSRSLAAIVKAHVRNITRAISSTLTSIKTACGRVGKKEEEVKESTDVTDSVNTDVENQESKAAVNPEDNKEVKECGDAPCADCDAENNDPIDDVDPIVADDVDGAIDPWDAVMQSIADIATDDNDDEAEKCAECGSNCECGSACEKVSDDELDKMYKEIMEATEEEGSAVKGNEPEKKDGTGEAGAAPVEGPTVETDGLKEGPDNDVLVSDLFKEIMKEAKGEKEEVYAQESVYESLMKRITEE